MATFTIKQGDTLPTLVATLKNPSGQPVDLSSSTVTFRMADLNGVLKASGAVTEVDFANGRVSYVWSSDDTDESGNFRAEFEVINEAGKKETYPNTQPITISVIKDTV